MKHLVRIGGAAASIALAVVLVSAIASTVAASSAQSSRSLPVITITMNKTSITVAGTLQSGAVDIRSTTTNEASGSPVLVRLNPGVTADQAFAFVASPAAQDPNNVSRLGSIVFDADAPQGTSDVQTTLQPGNYIAIDVAGNNPATQPHTAFTIAAAAQPVALPAAQATIKAIDFRFQGATRLHDGELVRFENRGFLVHMIDAVGVKNVATAKRVMSLLRAGKDTQAQRLASGFVGFMGPVSSGALQQLVVTAKPGVYVLVCFMATQDGREHTQLGMLRMIHITK
jgi:hypothetical protein